MCALGQRNLGRSALPVCPKITTQGVINTQKNKSGGTLQPGNIAGLPPHKKETHGTQQDQVQWFSCDESPYARRRCYYHRTMSVAKGVSESLRSPVGRGMLGFFTESVWQVNAALLVPLQPSFSLVTFRRETLVSLPQQCWCLLL